MRKVTSATVTVSMTMRKVTTAAAVTNTLSRL